MTTRNVSRTRCRAKRCTADPGSPAKRSAASRAPFSTGVERFRILAIVEKFHAKIYAICNEGLLQNTVSFGIESREFAVFLKYPARVVLAAAIISLISFSPASSRQWKTTPQILARDYAGITDSRPGETVMITWFVPQMMQPNATPAIAVTQKYVVLMVAHSRFDKVTGVNSYEDISALEPKDQNGNALAPVARTDLPTASVAMLAGLEAVLRQSLGPFGKGLKVLSSTSATSIPAKRDSSPLK